MDGVTGMLAWLSHVPVGSRVGLYWPANIDFRFVSHLRLQRARGPSRKGRFFCFARYLSVWERLASVSHKSTCHGLYQHVRYATHDHNKHRFRAKPAGSSLVFWGTAHAGARLCGRARVAARFPSREL